MGRAGALKAERRQWRMLTVEEQADRAEQCGADTLYYCKHPWAVKRYWVHEATGDVQRARCNRWECLYCGPRKVDLWRQLVKQAEPALFLTLTKAGKTVEQARRALTTFMQALRRGSKGRGPNHVGARAAYPVEYFGVMERHQDFERNGFHWHLLLKGVDHIPHGILKTLWISATRGKLKGEEADEKEASIVHIERIRNQRAIGYVTKYLTKSVSVGERGVKEVQREREVLTQDEEGGIVLERQVEMVKLVSKAHRLCYSRQFFPERVADLRKRLFAGMEDEAMEQGEVEHGKSLEEQVEGERCSGWRLVEREASEESSLEEVMADPGETRRRKIAEYHVWKRQRLVEVLEEMNEGRGFVSRRVINVWQYQRQQLRLAG